MAPPRIAVEKITPAYLRRNLRYDPQTGHFWWKIIYGRRATDRPAGTPDAKGFCVVAEPKKIYSGLCTGGPMDGRSITGEQPNVNIPIAAEGGGFAPGLYKWNDYVQMWIWQSSWKT